MQRWPDQTSEQAERPGCKPSCLQVLCSCIVLIWYLFSFLQKGLSPLSMGLAWLTCCCAPGGASTHSHTAFVPALWSLLCLLPHPSSLAVQNGFLGVHSSEFQSISSSPVPASAPQYPCLALSAPPTVSASLLAGLSAPSVRLQGRDHLLCLHSLQTSPFSTVLC